MVSWMPHSGKTSCCRKMPTPGSIKTRSTVWWIFVTYERKRERDMSLLSTIGIFYSHNSICSHLKWWCVTSHEQKLRGYKKLLFLVAFVFKNQCFGTTLGRLHYSWWYPWIGQGFNPHWLHIGEHVNDCCVTYLKCYLVTLSGMMSAAASLGLILLWDIDGGLANLDKYLYSKDDPIKVSISRIWLLIFNYVFFYSNYDITRCMKWEFVNKSSKFLSSLFCLMVMMMIRCRHHENYRIFGPLSYILVIVVFVVSGRLSARLWDREFRGEKRVRPGPRLALRLCHAHQSNHQDRVDSRVCSADLTSFH